MAFCSNYRLSSKTPSSVPNFHFLQNKWWQNGLILKFPCFRYKLKPKYVRKHVHINARTHIHRRVQVKVVATKSNSILVISCIPRRVIYSCVCGWIHMHSFVCIHVFVKLDVKRIQWCFRLCESKHTLWPMMHVCKYMFAHTSVYTC